MLEASGPRGSQGAVVERGMGDVAAGFSRVKMPQHLVEKLTKHCSPQTSAQVAWLANVEIDTDPVVELQLSCVVWPGGECIGL